MNYLKKLLLVCTCLLILSCYFSPPNNSSSSTEGIIPSWDSSTTIPGGDPENDTVFIEENEIITLSLCEEQYWSSQGYTLWSFDKETTALYNSLDFTVKKQSGTAEAGYGIIFAQYTKNNINNMLIVLLNTEGQYCVGELKGSRFYIIEPWTSKTFINKGYDIENNISISYKDKYVIAINSYTVCTVSNKSNLYRTGKVGYIAVVSPKDNFPDERVFITYEKK